MASRTSSMTDAELVEETRARLGKWNRFYFSFLGIAAVFLIVIIIFGVGMYQDIQIYAARLENPDVSSLPAAELAEISAVSNFYFGIATGAGLGAGIAASLFLLIAAVKIRQDFRRSSLLVKYHDLAKGEGITS